MKIILLLLNKALIRFKDKRAKRRVNKKLLIKMIKKMDLLNILKLKIKYPLVRDSNHKILWTNLEIFMHPTSLIQETQNLLIIKWVQFKPAAHMIKHKHNARQTISQANLCYKFFQATHRIYKVIRNNL